MYQILGGTSHPGAAPQTLILNRVKSLTLKGAFRWRKNRCPYSQFIETECLEKRKLDFTATVNLQLQYLSNHYTDIEEERKL